MEFYWFKIFALCYFVGAELHNELNILGFTEISKITLVNSHWCVLNQKGLLDLFEKRAISQAYFSYQRSFGMIKSNRRILESHFHISKLHSVSHQKSLTKIEFFWHKC